MPASQTLAHAPPLPRGCRVLLQLLQLHARARRGQSQSSISAVKWFAVDTTPDKATLRPARPPSTEGHVG